MNLISSPQENGLWGDMHKTEENTWHLLFLWDFGTSNLIWQGIISQSKIVVAAELGSGSGSCPLSFCRVCGCVLWGLWMFWVLCLLGTQFHAGGRHSPQTTTPNSARRGGCVPVCADLRDGASSSIKFVTATAACIAGTCPWAVGRQL